MEETIKVSLGLVAFTMTKDAHQRLHTYLEELSKHYSNKNYGKEIMEDIESRMAELLLEKNTKEEIVTLDRVNAVIDIMGKPSDIEDDADEQEENRVEGNNETSATTQSSEPIVKKLFRDIENRLIAGVCSGLGHYFNKDVVLFRLIFVVLFLPGILSDIRLLEFLSKCAVITYLVLWIAVPSAKTIVQKFAMLGKDPGLRGVETAYGVSVRPKTSAIGGVFKVGLGIISLLFGLSLFAALWTFLFIAKDAVGIIPTQAAKYLYLHPVASLLTNITMVMIIALPCFIFIYEGIKLIFGFKSPSWHPGLWAFLCWIVFLFIAISFVFRFAVNVDRGKFTSIEKTNLNRYYDTLLIQHKALPATLNGVDVEWNEIGEEIYSAIDGNGKRVYALYPIAEIDRFQSAVLQQDSILVKDTTAIAQARLYRRKLYNAYSKINDKSEDKEHFEENKPFEIKDSLVMLNPQIISKVNRFSGNLYRVRVEVPDSSVVLFNF